MKNDSDYELIKLVRNNDDKQSFQLLYNKYWGGLYKIALSKVGNEDDATDLVQDLFVTVWVKRKELNINENVDLYLFRALKNRIINFYRKKYLVEEKISLHTKNSVGFNDNTPDNIYLFKEVQTFINLEIEKLPEKM